MTTQTNQTDFDWLTLLGLNVKRYWKIIAAVAGVIIVYFFIRGQKTNFAQRLKEINDSHANEIKKINEIRQKERLELEENERLFDKRIEQIKLQYEKELADLDSRTRDRADQIMFTYRGDPDKLATELSRVTGFEIEIGDQK